MTRDEYRAFQALDHACALLHYIHDREAEGSELFHKMNYVAGDLADLSYNLGRFVAMMKQELNAE